MVAWMTRGTAGISPAREGISGNSPPLFSAFVHLNALNRHFVEKDAKRVPNDHARKLDGLERACGAFGGHVAAREQLVEKDLPNGPSPHPAPGTAWL